MLIPLSWLKNYVPVDDAPAELAHKLTMAGIEIGDVQIIGADWDAEKVVVGPCAGRRAASQRGPAAAADG